MAYSGQFLMNPSGAPLKMAPQRAQVQPLDESGRNLDAEVDALTSWGYSLAEPFVDPLRLDIKKAFYLVVSPNPAKSSRLTCLDRETGLRRQCWWIKIGDGRYRGAYKTHNPDILGQENLNMDYTHMGISRLVQTRSGQIRVEEADVRNGKALELEFFKEPSGNTKRYEWYRIWAKDPQNDNQLESELKMMLNQFPNYGERGLREDLQIVLGGCVIVPKSDDYNNI